MKIRTLIVTILGIIVVSNVSMAQDTGALEPESSFVAQAATAPTPDVPRPARQIPTQVARKPAPEIPTIVKIFELKYAKAENMAALIGNLFRIEVQTDYRLNRLIVNATKEQIESVENLIAEMDVPDIEASTQRDIQNLLYSIYMFETFSGNEGMKSFSMILRTTTHVSSQELLDAAAEKDLQISDFLQSDDFDEPHAEIMIKGRAASNESLKRMVSGLAPESHIIELKWDDDETFTNNIAAAQYTQLPDQMQKHIRKFLGDDIRTVGYWFGNSSVPGKIEAPIGPWTLNLQLDTESDRMLELNVEVEVPDEMHNFDRRLGRERNDEILSNTIRAKVGRPIIIGYNRESYGARKMGAMVIIPEVDAIQVKED
jgi:hypothetical protein